MLAIIDYGMGNLGSVKNAIEALGGEAMATRNPNEIAAASHIIMPGVGSFQKAMKNLEEFGLLPVLEEQVLQNKKPFLGLCLGMQLLATTGLEGGTSSGLGWIPGVTKRFEVDESKFKVPHVGWNDVTVTPGAKLFSDISNPVFYFVHSYHLVPDDSTVIAGEANHGEQFVAAVAKDNIFGLQFHPEKSQQAGLKILENFLDI